MRKLFTLAVVIAATLVAIPAQAQFKFGLKGGLNITDMSFSSDVFESSNRAGFFIGPTVKFTLPIVGLGVDASALYDQRQAKLKGSDKSMKQHAINIPINLRYNFGFSSLAGLYIATGPQYNWYLGSRNLTWDGESYGSLERSTFSWNVGAGVILLSHLQLGFTYNIAMGATGQIDNVGEAIKTFDVKNNTWQVRLAYFF